MPVTTLDPITALIVVDLQKAILAYPTLKPVDEIIDRSATLLHAFRAAGLPVVLVNVAGGAPGRTDGKKGGRSELPPEAMEFAPGLDQQASDHVITKRTWGAFPNTGLEELLKSLDVTQVVVTGIATSIGVESTARQAYEAGFNVTVATDAISDMNADSHENAVTRIFPRLGETGTTDEIIALLPHTSS